MPLPAIIIHGGAWAIPNEYSEASVNGVKAAAVRGYEVLKAGGSAVDAVEAAVVVMENDTVFDAGTGSVLNANGDIEMDSVIMNGSDLKLGAVAAVQNIENPVKLARKVMEETEHTMIVGAGANQYAEQLGIPTVPTDKLVTEEAKKEFERYLQFKTAVDVSFRFQGTGCDTVGAAAVDINGNVAFATSTGGITAKRPGRVGDSPLVGSGGYADNDSGAASTTGHGESITKVCLAYRCLESVKQGEAAQSAAVEGLEYMARRVKGNGGIVMVTKDGDFGFHFTTERMAWASLADDTLKYGIDPGDERQETL